MKNKLHWDDALDVWGVHGVGGFLGIVMLGIFANKQFNPAGANGLLYGNPLFLLKQVVAVTFSSVWAFVFTYAMLRIIDMFTTVKVSECRKKSAWMNPSTASTPTKTSSPAMTWPMP
jgi:ammonium transporter, Amt family